MTRVSVPSVVGSVKVVPVLRGLETSRVIDVASVLSEGGIPIVEVTMDSPDATESIAQAATRGICVGAGTIRTEEQARAAVGSGAQFLVAPHTDLDVVGWAVGVGAPIVPGVLTPTEAVSAWNAGAAAVKVFPASVVGPGFLEALRGPLPDVVAIPTGGITAAEARSYIHAGALAIGVGGWLTGHDDLNVVRTRAQALVEVCQNA